MSSKQVERERQQILDAKGRGRFAEAATYIKLSGPGWMQSALTLGGGSLGNSLYLGILAGLSMLWLQPFAMLLGVIMLSAISYVTLSTGQRPFRAINQHINPVLGWSWLLASLVANMVWSMPQYSLCFAVIEQNLLPDVFLGDGVLSNGQEASELGKWVVSIAIFVLCTGVTWSYASAGKGVRIYELVLKLVVAVIVLCFIGVVARMAIVGEGINWGAIFDGLIPKLHHAFSPAETFRPLLDSLENSDTAVYWSDLIVSLQRDVMLGSVATAVGINMTFLLPYNLLTRGWDRGFRGLAIFDLSTGMLIPFILATGCVVIAAATQFHAKLPEGCVVTANDVEVPSRLQSRYDSVIAERIAAASSDKYDLTEKLSLAEKKLAAVLVKRDTYDLAASLQRLFSDESGQGGRLFSNVIFGLGVVGMTLSTISLLMLISGFIACEVLDTPPNSWVFRFGCLACVTGVMWPWIWASDARAWLTVVTSVFGAMLLPIAYITFLFMMNSKSLMGEQRPRGGARIVWNTLMGIAVAFASVASVSAVYKKAGSTGLWVLGAYLAVVLFVQLAIPRKASTATPNTD